MSDPSVASLGISWFVRGLTYSRCTFENRMPLSRSALSDLYPEVFSECRGNIRKFGGTWFCFYGLFRRGRERATVCLAI